MMQFRDLARQYQVLKTDIDQAMLSVAAESHYIMGPPCFPWPLRAITSWARK